ncbi:hypothetical protein Slala02_26360 [Streptomyces lavendulae subsp. lavendulae]|nr:hypothetical protein Slala01_41290 [Streptomyces lavendulae subsp. lavendulae]GLX26816.1 hypothetical protein Slala02_26360 [Streptomyces lavendulae subsp. lavendulae]
MLMLQLPELSHWATLSQVATLAAEAGTAPRDRRTDELTATVAVTEASVVSRRRADMTIPHISDADGPGVRNRADLW